MANFFPDEEVALAQKKFGFSAVQPIRSAGIDHPKTGKVLVPRGKIEGLILSFINLKVCGSKTVVTMQLRAVPYFYPELFPTFYLVSPRSFKLIPEIYKNTKPEAAIQEAGKQRRDDPRNVGWRVDRSFSRVHFCQLEEVWNARPIEERNLGWTLSQLRGLLLNPTNATLAKAS